MTKFNLGTTKPSCVPPRWTMVNGSNEAILFVISKDGLGECGPGAAGTGTR